VDGSVEPVTEVRAEEHADLDLQSTRGLVELLNDEDAKVPTAVRSAAGPLAAAIDAIVQRLEDGGRLVYVGAGSSGRLALVDAAECGPTFGLPPGQVLAVVAGGSEALAVAQEAAEDDELAGEADLAAIGVGPPDAVVAVSASGTTPYVLGAARAAGSAGALTIAVVCAPASELGRLVGHEIVAVVGPELIAGSTRLKAGTAQKLVLNTISTVTMIRLGKTFGNLMVDLRATNVKLTDRSERIVAEVSGVGRDAARALLARAGGRVKLAIVMHALEIDAAEAEARLNTGGGVVRRVIGGDPPPVQ